MKKGSTVVHWTKADDALIAKMRAKGSTWEAVAKAVSTRKVKRSAEATMQRWRYTHGLTKHTKASVTPKVAPKTRKAASRGRLRSPGGAQSVAREFAQGMPANTKSVRIGGQTFNLPRV